MHKNQNGFTLVELVATIILIGIVSVTVIPRFSGRSGFAEYALQDQTLALLRVAQQRAMYDHGGSCYGVSFQSNQIQVIVDADGAGSDPATGLSGIEPLSLTGDYSDYSVSPTSTIYFDPLGNPLADCNNTPGARTITISGGDQILSVEVLSSGYIRKG